jgi:hypothetical protein
MSSFDLVPGEQIILQAKLKKDRWIKYRCVTCSLRCLATIYLAPLCIPAYAFCADNCRKEEADSFDLILTNQNLHCKQFLYQYGFCCQTSGTKVIPLEKIQDISLVSDWIGDNCGIVDKKGEIYQLQVQTAAMGTMLPELCVYCIEEPREFKRKVMEAKANLNSGQDKSVGGYQQQDISRILHLLGRQGVNDPSNT